MTKHIPLAIAACLVLAATGCSAANTLAAESSLAATARTSAATDTASSTATSGADLRTSDFTAYGIDSEWRAVLRAESMTTEGGDVGEYTVTVNRSVTGDQLRAVGTHGSKSFQLRLRQQSCPDNSGQNSGYQAWLTVDGTELSGCAVPGALAQADT